MTAAPAGGRESKGLLGRVAGAVTERVVDTVDPDIVLERIDLNALIDRVDLDAALARLDLDRLLESVDINALVRRLDVDEIVGRVDVDAVVRRLDLDALLARVDLNQLLARVELDPLVARVDPNAVVERVDPDALLDRVDVNALMARVDLNRLLTGVDLDALLRNLDLEALVRRSGIPDIVAESTYSMAGSALDVARRQLVGLDVVADRVVDRLMRRSEEQRLPGPPRLVGLDQDPPRPDTGGRIRPVRRTVSGHYAGAVSRAGAAVVDGLLIGALYTLGIAGLSFLLELFTSASVNDDRSTPLGIAAFAIWAFLYVFVSLAISGRTIGKGLAGLRVVRADGTAPGVRAMFVRTLAFPLSVMFFGIGLLMIVVQREHRSLHDLIAKSCVVYDWGDRSAEMPGPLSDFLNRAQSEIRSPEPG
jgi:uncharacterized RDD family membrane protein YckC